MFFISPPDLDRQVSARIKIADDVELLPKKMFTLLVRLCKYRMRLSVSEMMGQCFRQLLILLTVNASPTCTTSTLRGLYYRCDRRVDWESQSTFL